MQNVSVLQVFRPHTDKLPAGTYPGLWDKTSVTVTIDGKVYMLHTAQGVKQLGTRCLVTVDEDGKIRVSESHPIG